MIFINNNILLGAKLTYLMISISKYSDFPSPPYILTVSCIEVQGYHDIRWPDAKLT